jgi:hypothetical protein
MNAIHRIRTESRAVFADYVATLGGPIRRIVSGSFAASNMSRMREHCLQSGQHGAV